MNTGGPKLPDEDLGGLEIGRPARPASQPTNEAASRPPNFGFFGFPNGFIDIFWFYFGFFGFSNGFISFFM